MKSTLPYARLALLAGLAFVSTFNAALSPCRAGTHVWTGTVNGYWSTPGNWESNFAPTNAAETGVVLRFPVGPTRVVTTNNIGHLSLSSVILAGDNYTLRSQGGYSLSFSPVFGINLLVSGGNNTIACPIQIGGLCNVSVGASDTFTIASTISGPGSFSKLGDGTLVLAGNGPNSFIGGFNAYSGLVRLRQTSGVALPGPVRIGSANPDTAGGAIRLQANNQIAPYTTVGVEWDGVLYLNGFTNSLGTVSLVGGAVNTISNTIPGLLIVQNEILADEAPQANPSMGGTIALNGTRSIQVTNGVLTITARVIDGDEPGGFSKRGQGQLRLTGNNTFRGTATVVEGSLKAETATALGSTDGGTVLLGKDSALYITDKLIFNESLSVSNYYTYLVTEGTNTWLGPITFVYPNASISFVRSPETLRTTLMRLGGTISGPGRVSFDVDYAEMFGTEANTYSFHTGVGARTELRLNKTGAIAIPGDIYFGFSGDQLSRVVVQQNEQIADSAEMNFFVGEDEFGPAGELIANGVTETIGRIYGEGRIHCTNATLRLSGSGYFQGSLLGNGLSTIIKSGTNDYTFLGDQTYYAGKLIVEDGSLTVLGRYPKASFQVYTAGILSGGGPLATVTLNGGTLAPGTSPDYSAGSMTITNLASANGKYRCSLGFAFGSPATTDNLVVKQLTGSMTLQLVPHFTGALSNEFTILTPLANPFPAGTFTGLGEGAIITTTAGQSFRISYHGGITGQAVTLTQLTLPTPPQISGINKDAGGIPVITGTGIPGMYYTLMVATNIANPVWEPQFTVIAEAPSGAISIHDFESDGHPVRFYKLKCNSGIGE